MKKEKNDKTVVLNYKQDCTELNKEDVLPRIKQNMLSQIIGGTNADRFSCEFEVNPYSDEDAWRYVDMHASDNGTYFNYGKQYEPQELFDLVKEKCFYVILYFDYRED